MAIQVRRGNEVDFDGSKMKSGEFATTVDSKKVYHAFSAGDVTELATRAEMETMIGDITDDIITETTTAINTAIDNAETATTNAQTEIGNMQTLEDDVEDTEALRVTAEIARQNATTGEAYRIANETEREEWYDATKVMETYNPTTAYVPENKVTYGGSTWRNKVACTGVTPVEGVNWTIFAQKGIDGTGGDMSTTIYDTIGKSQDIFAYSDTADKLQNAETVGNGILYNSGGLVTAQSTPNMTVAVSSCTAYMPTGERAVISAVASQAITTADATNPRKDIIYINSSKVISYLVGTASATPTAPSLPSGGILLAEIYVGAGVTSITNANITDKRQIIKSNADLTASTHYKTMGVTIDLSNSNPLTSVAYTDDAIGMVVGSKQWDDFFGHYPCILKDGVETTLLNPNDFTKDIYGNTVDLASATVGDIMIAFPRLGLKINTYGTTVYIKMTNNPYDSAYEYNAHTRGTVRKDKFYLGAYIGYVDNSKLRSWSGKTPTASQTIGAFRTLAHANGSGYEQSAFYQLTFRQCMYVLKYKNLDSQTALGRGYVDSNSAIIATGGTNTKGMDYGETTGKLQVKLFGLEDFWGNVNEWIDGLCTDGNRNLFTGNDAFNDSATGYINNGQGAISNIGNYMSEPQGNTKTGFIAKTVSGSSSTYFCDYSYLTASRVATFGGSFIAGSGTGIFLILIDSLASDSGTALSGRLMYL